ncbi:uncharacterized protein FIESC28_02352 [Fusarium coffeatum]|uniref:Pyrimidine 5'-nucleotidase n=1 Tax=Fusarium coffeatum TaxID=231269 RepID=A0A366S794_9HYPO|nr:uncharacterized protein FIESC28_02352 [Fusarium coffeatum]RBR24862.1 hypothetical protein FIESC28_02352 [Fusarium coffeatum]
MGSIPETAHFFFDIDNCLYTRDYQVEERMSDLISSYVKNQLGKSPEETKRLREKYKEEYCDDIQGLVHDFQINVLDYNSKVDKALPLDGLIKPDPELKRLLEDIDTTKVKLWIFTNSYVTHAERVLNLLGVDGLFEGLTYCDWQQQPIIAKPQGEMYQKAMKEAGVSNASQCYFIDDSWNNCAAAEEMGWTAIHFVEEGLSLPNKPASKHHVQRFEELKLLFPHFFKHEQ